MNNSFYKITDYLHKIAKENPLVETVLFASTENKDLYSNTKFPLIHINPTTSTFVNEKVSRLSFEIGVFTIRDTTNQSRETIWEGNDNIIDNQNTTYAILLDMLTKLKEFNEDLIEMEDNISLQPVTLSDRNGLDGYIATVTMTTPNKINC